MFGISSNALCLESRSIVQPGFIPAGRLRIRLRAGSQCQGQGRADLPWPAGGSAGPQAYAGDYRGQGRSESSFRTDSSTCPLLIRHQWPTSTIGGKVAGGPDSVQNG